jgi:DNA-binding HxlR family transcriptional regulator
MARRPAKTCELSEVFRLLGAPHVLDILHVALLRGGPSRFKDFQGDLGISPNTLTERLKELVGAGLLLRQAFSEIPPRVEYRPSAKATELTPVFETLEAWSKRNNLAPAAVGAQQVR